MSYLKIQSWVYFKNKIITIPVKNQQVNSKIKHSVATSSSQKQKASNDTIHVKFHISMAVLSTRMLI